MRFCCVLACGVAISLSFMPGSGYADIMFTGPTSITVPEDGAAHDFFYTLTNNSGGAITNLSVGATNVNLNLISGDRTDAFGSVQYALFGVGLFGSATCTGAGLANGASCTFELIVTPENGAGETDQNFATFGPEVLDAGFTLATGVTMSESVSALVTVTDPGFVSSVPEPSSILLEATVLGLLGLFLRYRNSAPMKNLTD